MSGRTPGTAAHTPATGSDAAALRQHGSSKQASVGLNAAAVPADGQPASNLSRAGLSASQAAARHTSVEDRGKAAVSSALRKSLTQGELPRSELKEFRSVKAAEQAGVASQAKPSERAVPRSMGAAKQAALLPQAPASLKAVPSIMGPPPARKRPLHPDGPLPTKKRQAVEGAQPPAYSLAAGQLVQSGKQASKSATAPVNKQVHHLG